MIHVDRRYKSRRTAIVIALGAMLTLGAQEKADKPNAQKETPVQYVVIMKRGPKWIAGKGAAEQPLLKHGMYLKELMDKGTLQYAGAFLDDSGGFILLNVSNESEARRITEHDPGVMAQILQPEIHPVRIAFDAATGKSPFQ
jgi:uncharacterized protein YciI